MPTSNVSLYAKDREQITRALRGEGPAFPVWYWALRLSRTLSTPPWEIQGEFGLSLSRREWCERAEVALRAEKDSIRYPQGQFRASEPLPPGYLRLSLLPAPFTESEPEPEAPVPTNVQRAEDDLGIVYRLPPPPGTIPLADPNAHLMDCQYRRTIPRAS